MSECNRSGKWIRGCRFEPRYDVGEPDMAGIGTIQHYLDDVPDIIRACRPSTYVHDICIRCGKIVQRTPNTPANGETET